MSTETPQSAPTLEDFVDLFAALDFAGVEFVIIGGMAVGAYARLINESVVSMDLDLLVTTDGLARVVADVEALGAELVTRPRERALPVAVLIWHGRELNFLTTSSGLPPAPTLARSARSFLVEGPGQTSVLIADPLDLLRNKLAVKRAKDEPHIALLRRYLDLEAQREMETEADPRDRIFTASQLLDVLGQKTLDEPLAQSLVALATHPADFRFLAHRVPTRALLDSLAARATPDLQRLVTAIGARRTFDTT